MITVNIHEAKTNLSALLSKVEDQKDHILICRYDKPIAEIIPYKAKKRMTSKKSLKPIAIKTDLTLPVSEDWNVE